MAVQISVRPGRTPFRREPTDHFDTAPPGLILPYGCRDGACRSMPGQVLSGEVDHGQSATSCFERGRPA